MAMGFRLLGAALVLGGDDHVAKSSTIPHQSDLSFYNFGMPVFYPGNTQEVLDYGLLGIALSRFSGAWVAMKMVTNTMTHGRRMRALVEGQASWPEFGRNALQSLLVRGGCRR